jgi:hypothetical protein
METKAVVDRIEDGTHAVLLVGEEEREFVVAVEQLPAGAREGTWLRARVEGEELVVLGIDAGENEAVKQRIEDKLARLRQRGRKPGPAPE